jgi:hypothetical protein
MQLGLLGIQGVFVLPNEKGVRLEHSGRIAAIE